MTISSMTGFARNDGACDGLTWGWELRSVNSRGLDVRLRLPPGYDSLEPGVRDAVGKKLQRGSVAISLTIDRQSGGSALRLNETLLGDILAIVERVRALSGGPPPDTMALLAVKGVLETAGGIEDPEKRSLVDRALMESLHVALASLIDSRRSEGSRLKAIIHDQLVQIEKLAAEVRASPSRTVEAVRQRLRDTLARVMDAGSGFDADRLHQEAMIAATRADVEEELARLDAHVAAARDILTEPAAVGRKLDFLAQEFNREANTLCSKANAIDVTRSGLALKGVIDQLREQVQNIE